MGARITRQGCGTGTNLFRYRFLYHQKNEKFPVPGIPGTGTSHSDMYHCPILINLGEQIVSTRAFKNIILFCQSTTDQFHVKNLIFLFALMSRIIKLQKSHIIAFAIFLSLDVIWTDTFYNLHKHILQFRLNML